MQAVSLKSGSSSTCADLFATSSKSSDASSFKRTFNDAVQDRRSTGDEAASKPIDSRRDTQADNVRDQSTDRFAPKKAEKQSLQPVSKSKAKRESEEDSTATGEIDAGKSGKVKKSDDASTEATDGDVVSDVSEPQSKVGEAESKDSNEIDSATTIDPNLLQLSVNPNAPTDPTQAKVDIKDGDAVASAPVAINADDQSQLKVAGGVQAGDVEGLQKSDVAAEQSGEGAIKTKSKSDGDIRLDDIHADVEDADVASKAPAEAGSKSSKSNHGQGDDSGNSANLAAEQIAQKPEKADASDKPASSFERAMSAIQGTEALNTKADTTQVAKVAPPVVLTPEQKFLHDNVDQVVTSIRTQSTSGGGQMNVRLDPPELGALQVAVKMVEGRLSASFTTSSDQATQLLSHSLQQLKSSLESSGINVDRIEVRQAPPSEQSQSKSNSDSQQQQNNRGFDSHSHQSEQHRKEMIQKMWRKIALGTDDLDLVA